MPNGVGRKIAPHAEAKAPAFFRLKQHTTTNNLRGIIGARRLCHKSSMADTLPRLADRCLQRDGFRLSRLPLFIAVLLTVCSWRLPSHAQDSFEIEVYGSETLPRGETGVELQSNFNVEADESSDPRMYPSQHALNETLEVSHGFRDWLQCSFYILSSIHSSFGWQWAGDRLRPQVRVPEAWDWPVGLSLSAELGYQRPRFSADTWTLELLPIVDKKIGRWYVAFNPTFDRSLHGPGTAKGVEFSPNVKASYDIFRRATAGLEYYSSYGPIGAFDPLQQQQHQLVPSLELDLPNNWELNVGYGIGLTTGTNEQVLKVIVGHRFGGSDHAKDQDKD